MAALASASALSAAGARADAIMPPPAACPEGSNPASSHAGSYCAVPYACSDTGCSPGDECATVHVCARPRQGFSMGGPFTVEEVVAACEPGSTCADGSACQERVGCVHPPPSLWSRALPDDDDGDATLALATGACGCIGAPLLAGLAIALVRARARRHG